MVMRIKEATTRIVASQASIAGKLGIEMRDPPLFPRDRDYEEVLSAECIADNLEAIDQAIEKAPAKKTAAAAE